MTFEIEIVLENKLLQRELRRTCLITSREIILAAVDNAQQGLGEGWTFKDGTINKVEL